MTVVPAYIRRQFSYNQVHQGSRHTHRNTSAHILPSAVDGRHLPQTLFLIWQTLQENKNKKKFGIFIATSSDMFDTLIKKYNIRKYVIIIQIKVNDLKS